MAETFHVHILTEHGEDVACAEHRIEALEYSLDAPMDHTFIDAEDDLCGRCFICEGVQPGSARPVGNNSGQVHTDGIQVKGGNPVDGGNGSVARIVAMPSVDAEYKYGYAVSLPGVRAMVGERAATRLLILRSKLQDAAMRADYGAEYCFGRPPHHIEADA